MREQIETSHDLARLLEDWAKILRELPETSLSMQGKSTGAGDRARNAVGACVAAPELDDLARRVASGNKETARSQLEPLTVKEIREVASRLRVRTPSKVRKDEAVEMLLRHVFDIPAGQDLVRTFREGGSSGSE